MSYYDSMPGKPLPPPPPCGGMDGDCTKIAYEYAEVSVPVTLKPNVCVKDIHAECCGEPQVECGQHSEGETCEIIVTQRIKIKIPVKFAVTACVGESDISCDCDGPGCPCKD